MDPELEAVRSLYGGRSDLAVDVDVHRRLDRRSFRALLESDVDFLHYVGHATPDGLECPDGRMLDVATVGETGVTAFCLNACQSYTQGRRLIEAGALGGVVTHGDVGDEMAHRIGAMLARLLNNGYPLGAALQVTGIVYPVGAQYSVVGQEDFSVGQGSSGWPVLWKANRTSGGLEIKAMSFSAQFLRGGVGGYVQYHFGGKDVIYPVPSVVGPFEVDSDEIRSISRTKLPPPILIDDELLWGRNVEQTLRK
jgi:hypothetical protein